MTELKADYVCTDMGDTSDEPLTDTIELIRQIVCPAPARDVNNQHYHVRAFPVKKYAWGDYQEFDNTQTGFPAHVFDTLLEAKIDAAAMGTNGFFVTTDTDPDQGEPFECRFIPPHRIDFVEITGD